MHLKNFAIRTLVAVLFGPAILFSAWVGGKVFLGVIIAIVSLAMYEFYDLAAHKGSRPQKILGIITGVLVCYTLFRSRTDLLWVVLFVSFIVFVTVELFRNERGSILNVASTLMGVFYVAFSLGFLLLIRELPVQFNLPYDRGGDLVILTFLTIWMCDIAASILGSLFGKHKLFERVSPHKTIEGAVAGFFFATITAYLCQVTFMDHLPLLHALAIGAICGSVGQVSDLIESLFKRDAVVKDSSKIIPGHGGVLDRFDSPILAAPAVYFYLRFVAHYS